MKVTNVLFGCRGSTRTSSNTMMTMSPGPANTPVLRCELWLCNTAHRYGRWKAGSLGWQTSCGRPEWAGQCCSGHTWWINHKQRATRCDCMHLEGKVCQPSLKSDKLQWSSFITVITVIHYGFMWWWMCDRHVWGSLRASALMFTLHYLLTTICSGSAEDRATATLWLSAGKTRRLQAQVEN